MVHMPSTFVWFGSLEKVSATKSICLVYLDTLPVQGSIDE